MVLARKVLESVTWYLFNSSNLALVPSVSGVYWLGINNQVIYIGSSANLHERLSDHYYTVDQCIGQARQFAIDPCFNYKERERRLLQAFLAKYGRLPKCNDRI
jgi:hypothetical protein